MRAAIRSGRCPVPPEWRDPLGLRFWQRSAIIAVTGAPGRSDALDILCGHLPLIGHKLEDNSGTPTVPGTGPGPQLPGSEQLGSPADLDALEADGLGLPGWDSHEAGPGREDEETARRMARRLSRAWPAKGVRALVKAGFIPAHQPAVYAWRRTANGEHVYRIWPDGSFTPIAVLRHIQVPDRHGQLRTQLAAGRPW